ncbi:DEAD/DEAH box helicase [Streptomycetaceae bacterium NBC_01309]
MRPTLEARQLKASLLQYLSTTYALADEGVRTALETFLGNEDTGMFRGPYLRIRTPFTHAADGWQDSLDWVKPGFAPYAHQALAFARLGSAGGRTPQPTIVTTGTGSGKTESFLLPILDHCRREKAAGVRGVKAILLYPMNALATDQALRLDKELKDGDLAQVTAGLYIGDVPSTTYPRVATLRQDMRRMPPDILITNYKMLDLLIQRADDIPLWEGADVRYVVVDEFHTYDGAQGTDVAMLLRRLASALDVAEPGRPLGSICPVATSATLAAGTDADDTRDLLDVAAQVFGTVFDADAVIGEDRLDVEQFVPSDDLDPVLPMPDPSLLAGLPDPSRDDAAFAELVRAVTGDASLADDPHALGRVLKKHILTQAVMKALAGGLSTQQQVLDRLWRAGAYSWGEAITRRPEQVVDALARFIALLSTARSPDSTPERPLPFVHVEVHQWARAVSRLLRGIMPWPAAEFRWDTENTPVAVRTPAQRSAPLTSATAGEHANVFLPAVYCRDCGRSGWAVLSPESNERDVDFTPAKIRRASVSRDKRRVRNLVAATHAEARSGSPEPGPAVRRRRSQGGGATLMVLDGVEQRLRDVSPTRDYDPETGAPHAAGRDSAFVLVNMSDTADTAAKEDWCPACGERNAIVYLGTGPAALAAASITELFTGNELKKEFGERKTLMFNDSVQDAAHRAGFVANRSYTFSLRALLAGQLDRDRPTALNDLIADVVGAAATDRDTLAAVVPPDLHRHERVALLLSDQARRGDLETWRLIGERLALATLMEFGLRSRQGRTLELTRTAAAFVDLPDPAAIVEIVRGVHLDGRATLAPMPQDDARYLGFVRILLERLRSRGAVRHRWFDAFVSEAGVSRYSIWGNRPAGMPAFPAPGVSAPRFLLDRHKNRSEFDNAAGRLSWYELWARRCLELPREDVPDFWARLLPALVDADLLAMRVARDNATRVHGLHPASVRALLLDDDQVADAYVRCPTCFWEQTVHPELVPQWHGQPCPSYRCSTGRLESGRFQAEDRPHERRHDYRDDYYRRLYREAGTYQVVTAEHTGMLTRAERESVEAAFRDGGGFNDPNVLSCTPTLELGIDIGDLSAVVLGSLPRSAASYAQRVGRAGRRTGNAYLLTIPDRSRRDLYFLEQPEQMIAGRIVPPGAHLSAVAILRRQYLAHLLDLAARGRLVDGERVLRPLPTRAVALFGESGYLRDLLAVVLRDGESLVAGFLALFPGSVEPHAAEDLRQYAVGRLRGAVEDAERAWTERITALRERLAAVRATQAELNTADTEDARQHAELGAEARATGSVLRDIGNTTAHGALTELGLLPNYALADDRCVLDATLYWRESDEDTGAVRYGSEVRPYERAQRLALAEFAPGNVFYVNGYRHEVTGLDIGSRARPAWSLWRVCPDCGFVRVSNAEADRSPCPRCHSHGIADSGCLHRVIRPTRVTSRDNREDAVIRDDRDQREIKAYTVKTAVDIPEESIEGAWRHTRHVFGVDFSRRATIRTFNLGLSRADNPAGDEFAGHTVRLNPFHVCTGCGAASADGRPVFDHDTDALTTSAARNPALKHHRPWCPLRRGRRDGADQVPVLLAHELETEAVRVLLPASTFHDDAKVHSFRAALRLGVDRHYGGDPAHLDTTLASMHDQATGDRRSFLVLYDRLPGGTGYLHRLSESGAFRATLADALDELLACPCADEGRAACHRCLLRYTEDAHHDLVSRREAIELLEQLLFDTAGDGTGDGTGSGADGREDGDGHAADGWTTEPVLSTGAIGLDRQVESALEERFLDLLRTWALDADDAVLDEEGRHSGHLRITSSDDVVHWRLTAQELLDGTRADFAFARADGPPQTLKLYLDGRRFHASPEHNRTADDAARRAALRGRGHTVFQLTWDDLDNYVSGGGESVWPPYVGGAQAQARQIYEDAGGGRAEFGDTVFANPLASLVAFLRDPDPVAWARRAGALAHGLMANPGTVRITGTDDPRHLAETLRGTLAAYAQGRDPVPVPTGPPGNSWHIFATRDGNGLPIVAVLDARDDPTLRWTLLPVLPDGDTDVSDEAHPRRWRAWLYWTNLAQFLAHQGGDGVQLTSRDAADFAVETLSLFGAAAGAEQQPGGPGSPPPASDAEEALAELVRDAGWDDTVLPYLTPEDDADTHVLAHILADAGAAAAIPGHELGTAGWLAELAWPDRLIAVVLPPDGDEDDEARRRDEAYREKGWQVRTASEWAADLDGLLAALGVPRVTGADRDGRSPAPD